jgi:hypothetical protein
MWDKHLLPTAQAGRGGVIRLCTVIGLVFATLPAVAVFLTYTNSQ